MTYESPGSSASEPEPKKNLVGQAGWVNYSSTSNTVVIFIHGFMSTGPKCWMNKNGAYWPQLVAVDPRLNDVSVYVAEYFTSATSYEYGIADCAIELYQSLCVRQENENRSPWSFENIIFVCHSLGGIVVRYLLCNHYPQVKPKPIGLVLMASPSYGSGYADTLSLLSKVFGNKVGRQLKLGNDFLQDLDRRFKRLLSENKEITGTEGVETKFFFGSRFLQRIVSWESAGRYFGEPQRIPNADHSLIVKPRDTSHPSHNLLLNFFHHEFAKIAIPHKTKKLGNTSSERAEIGKILFDAYDKSCREFYFNRDLDVKLSDALNIYAVWVYGPTGTGKTSSIRHYLSEKNQQPIEISFSHLSENLNIDTCIKEISATCEQFETQVHTGEATLTSVCRALAKRATVSSVILYIDEIPISHHRPAEANLFIQFIADLLIQIKQNVGSNCTIVLSSLEKPDFRDNNKLKEQMTFSEVPVWSTLELTNMYRFIVSKFAPLAVPEIFVKTLIDEAGGSPRFLKTFLRNRYLNKSTFTDEIVLAQTKEQYDWRKND